MSKLKRLNVILILLSMIILARTTNAQTLKLHYGLSGDAVNSKTVIDESGSGYTGSLMNSAKVSTYNGVPVIDLGTTSGYVDMGTGVGNLIASLGDFTIMTKLFIPTTSTITGNGNFIWTFANSNNIGTAANGCMFLSAKSGRYAITLTNYTAESGIQTGSALTKGAWKTVIYIQKSGAGRLFIDGNLVASGAITLNPSALKATAYNYLGRSCYSGDTYLNNAKLADFRVYDGAISDDQISSLSGVKPPVTATTLLVQYDFDKTSDTSGQYAGALMNGAALSNISGIPVLDLGANNGYFDFGAKLGNVISTLDSFSISTNLYIPGSTDISGNGNFAWTFANSSDMATTANGNMFLSAKNSRYAISTTGYSAEQSVSLAQAMTKGKWLNATYTQAYNTGRLYIDGVLVAGNAVAVTPSQLGATAYNYLGRSCYASDAYLKNAQYSKFRIYKGSLSGTQVADLYSEIKPLNDYLYRTILNKAKSEITISHPDSITGSLVLTNTTSDGVTVTWSSSNTGVISNNGIVFRPANGLSPASVTLKAYLSYNGLTDSVSFNLTVIPLYTDQVCVDLDLSNLKITGNINNLHSAVGLPITCAEGSKVEWSSDSPDYINSVGKVLKLSPLGSGKKSVILTAKVTKGSVSASRNFEVKVAEDDGKSAYLFVYFTGNTQAQEQIRFALSNDGYNYTPLNNGNPVVSSDTISIKQAVRDPHILRGEDGKTFYMVVTDMKSSEGWSSNRGIVLLKSTDMVHWQHATVNFPTKWPATMTNVTRVWAPETIYDPKTGKYIVYFSLLTSDGTIPYDKVYYCYANKDFTDLEGEPTLLFDRGTSTIDGDIVYNEADSLYHMFFKNEALGGISEVTSTTLTAQSNNTPGSQWSTPSAKLQQTTEAVEGVGVFKLINSDNWAMMYDCYANGHYQYCSSPDLFNFTYVQDNYNISARHGTTIAITADEAKALLTSFPTTGLTNVPLGSRSTMVRQDFMKIDNTNQVITLPVYYGTDLTSFSPYLYATAGTVISPSGAQDFSKGAVSYQFTLNNATVTYQVSASVEANPVIPDFHADPEVLYSEKTGRFYIYPTTDGYSGWAGYYFDVFSSPDLVNWTNEGTMLNLPTQTTWASGYAWAPAIEEKKVGDQSYRYYFYFSGESSGKKIGVAVADDPAGPFVDSGKPLISTLPSGASGQIIDVDVFTDPQSGKSYLYYGNGYMAVAELNDDMVSIKDGTTKVITPTGGTTSTYAYREGSYVFYRNGIYYFLWSVDDTGVSNYHVAYGTSSSPTGPITVATQPIVILQDAANQIYGTGHNSILKVPGKDEWYIVYHRINQNYLSNGPGYHREVCIDRLNFNSDGTIQQVTTTRKGIAPVILNATNTAVSDIHVDGNSFNGKIVKQYVYNYAGQLIGNDISKFNQGIFIVKNIYDDQKVEVKKIILKIK